MELDYQNNVKYLEQGLNKIFVLLLLSLQCLSQNDTVRVDSIIKNFIEEGINSELSKEYGMVFLQINKYSEGIFSFTMGIELNSNEFDRQMPNEYFYLDTLIVLVKNKTILTKFYKHKLRLLNTKTLIKKIKSKFANNEDTYITGTYNGITIEINNKNFDYKFYKNADYIPDSLSIFKPPAGMYQYRIK